MSRSAPIPERRRPHRFLAPLHQFPVAVYVAVEIDPAVETAAPVGVCVNADDRLADNQVVRRRCFSAFETAGQVENGGDQFRPARARRGTAKHHAAEPFDIAFEKRLGNVRFLKLDEVMLFREAVFQDGQRRRGRAGMQGGAHADNPRNAFRRPLAHAPDQRPAPVMAAEDRLFDAKGVQQARQVRGHVFDVVERLVLRRVGAAEAFEVEGDHAPAPRPPARRSGFSMKRRSPASRGPEGPAGVRAADRRPLRKRRD